MSVQKMLSILDLYTLESREWNVDQMANTLSMPKSSLYRHIKFLRDNGFLNESDEGYKLGYKFLEMASIVKEDLNLTEIARPFMNKITDMFGETAILSVLSNYNVVCLGVTTSPKSVVRVSSEEGAILPLYAGGSSKAIFAFQKDIFIDEFLTKTTLEKFSNNTLMNKENIWNEVLRIRDLGYSTSNSERDDDVLSIGYPIRDKNNKVFASIAIAGPSVRFSKLNEQEVVEELQRTVKEIEKYIK